MKPISRSNRNLWGFGAAAILSALALWMTYSLPLLRNIPWSLSFLAVVIVAWVGGMKPAAVTIAASAVGVYVLVLVPGGGYRHDPIALFKTAAFVGLALFTAYLLRQRNVALRSLEASEKHYRSATETASDVIITMDSESRILSVNPAVRAVFGYEPEELVGEQMPILMPERLRPLHRAGLANHLATGKRHIPWTGMQLQGLRKNGEEIPLEISFGSYTVDGETRFTGFVRDISERRKSEAALLQSEKLAAVGRLASSIAHEINNPLESVTNLLYLSRGCDSVEDIHRYLESAEQELARVSVIANQTLQFNKSASVPALVKCDPLLGGSLALFQGRLQNARVAVSERRRAQSPAFCVEGEMRQVINNLIGNAIDALQPRGGRLLVRSRDAADWKNGQRGVVLTVADDGIGMSPETLGKSFEAFFSTKGSNGVGLGLWICRQLVQQNRGRLRVRSSQRNGRSGTVFTLFLPCADGRQASGADDEHGVFEAGARGRGGLGSAVL